MCPTYWESTLQSYCYHDIVCVFHLESRWDDGGRLNSSSTSSNASALPASQNLCCFYCTWGWKDFELRGKVHLRIPCTHMNANHMRTWVISRVISSHVCAILCFIVFVWWPPIRVHAVTWCTCIYMCLHWRFHIVCTVTLCIKAWISVYSSIKNLAILTSLDYCSTYTAVFHMHCAFSVAHLQSRRDCVRNLRVGLRDLVHWTDAPVPATREFCARTSEMYYHVQRQDSIECMHTVVKLSKPLKISMITQTW